MDREDSPEPVIKPAVLGYLRYVDRKTGEVKQHYPIDAEKITFGRDPDCDIRLHWDDISRVHAEIQFDLLEGSATLSVTGANGLIFIGADQEHVKLKVNTQHILSTGDSFLIRKKLFIFEYPTQSLSIPLLSPGMLNTPVRRGTPAKPPASSTPLRRRASHRLSLMPPDKPFVPLSPMKRRKSNAGEIGGTPKKSHLANAVEEDEVEDDIMEGIVDVQQSEDGDMMILETREETPEVAQEPVAAPPKTPRSVPLPLPTQTLYVRTPPRVPSKVAMSTPPGPMTLHKALLLRSARKAWVESRPNDVDDAVADGKIEVARRKSRSPSKEEGGDSKRKSLTPRKSVVEPDSDISEDSEDEEEEIAAGRAALQWVQEDPGAEASFVEGDSAEDCLEADFSLDIPGEGVLDCGSQAEADVSASEEEGPNEDEDEDESFDSVKENRQEHEPDAEGPAQEEEDVDEDEDDDLFDAPAHSTPANSRILNQFYTPQVPRQQNQPRRSLAAIGGPATRAFGASPNPLGGGAFRPTPSKPGSTPLPTSREEDDGDEGIEYEGIKPIQTSVSDRELAEIKKRRQSLATPRQLPQAPMSFRDPIKGPFGLAATPSHPALTRSPTKDADAAQQDNTPMGDIRFRLDKMKRDSSARELSRPAKDGRRATVGFVLPETPARPSVRANASYTAAPAARFGEVAPPTPTTPVVRPSEDEGDSVISSLHHTPVRSTVKKASTPFSLVRRTPIQEAGESEDELPTLASPPMPLAATPIKRAGVPARRDPRLEPKTPYMGDIRTLYPSIPSPASPVLAGIKNLYPSLPLPPKTPDMRGMKGMFAPGRQMSTPGMEGVEEMFASPARNSPARAARPVRVGDMEAAGAMEDAAYRSPRVSRRLSVAPRELKEAMAEEQMAVEEDLEAVQHISPIRQPIGSARHQMEPVDTAPKAAKPLPSTRAPRTTKPTESAISKSAPTRTRAAPAPTEEVAEVDKASTSTRRRAAVPAAALIIAAAPAEARSKPSRRAPAAAVEPDPVEEAAAPVKPTRSRAVSAKAPTKSSVGPSSRPASPETKSAPAGRGRAKKVLAEAAEQPIPDAVKAPSAVAPKPARTRTAAAAAVPAPVIRAEKKSVSAPTRRTRALKDDAEEKENVEEKSAPGRAAKARGAKKETTAAVVEAVASTSRATRSRK